MPVNPAAGSPIRAVKKLLGGAKEEPEDKPTQAPAKKAPSKTRQHAKRRQEDRHQDPGQEGHDTVPFPGQNRSDSDQDRIQRHRQEDRRQEGPRQEGAGQEGAPAKGGEPHDEESKIPAGIDLADALEVRRSPTAP